MTASSPFLHLGRSPPVAPGSYARGSAFAARLTAITLSLMAIASSSTLVESRMLDEKDWQRLSEINVTFMKLTDDLAQSSKRQDISRDESDCLRFTWQELSQTSQELSSYQYLIEIANETDDAHVDETIRSVMRFAIDKTIEVLASERRRLAQPSDQCLRFSASVGLSQRAVQLMDATAAALRSIRPRV